MIRLKCTPRKMNTLMIGHWSRGFIYTAGRVAGLTNGAFLRGGRCVGRLRPWLHKRKPLTCSGNSREITADRSPGVRISSSFNTCSNFRALVTFQSWSLGWTIQSMSHRWLHFGWKGISGPNFLIWHARLLSVGVRECGHWVGKIEFCNLLCWQADLQHAFEEENASWPTVRRSKGVRARTWRGLTPAINKLSFSTGWLSPRPLTNWLTYLCRDMHCAICQQFP